MHLVDVSEVGRGQLQGGDFVALGVTQGHQHVQLVAVDANPPPADPRQRERGHGGRHGGPPPQRPPFASLCSPALPLHQIVPLLPAPRVPRAASPLRAAARPLGAVLGGFRRRRDGPGAVVAPVAPGGGGRLGRGVCGEGQTDTAVARVKKTSPGTFCAAVAGTLAVDGVLLPR